MSRLIHPIIATLIILVFGALEGSLYPVVRLWSPQHTILLQDLEGQSLRMAGFMHTVRSCRFLGVHAEAEDGDSLQVVFMDDSVGLPSKAGSQEWGPWKVNLKPFTQSVGFYAVHDCHPLWSTKTFLGEELVAR
jgi:hypothetical protein